VEKIAECLVSLIKAIGVSEEKVRVDQWEADRHLRGVLPAAVREFWYRRVGTPGLSCWGPVRAGAVPQVSVDRIQAKIDEKQSRVSDYISRCDELWLLIVVCGG